MLIKRVLYSSGDPRSFKTKTAIARVDQARAAQHKMMAQRLEKRALFITISIHKVCTVRRKRKAARNVVLVGDSKNALEITETF